jgi:hypothetical protein
MTADLPDIYGAASEWEAYRCCEGATRWMPCPSVQLDRFVQAVFETSDVLSLQDMLRRVFAFARNAGIARNDLFRDLGQACLLGLVAFVDVDGEPGWRLVRRGVVLLPRFGDVFDTRNDEYLGPVSLRGLMSRERKRRARILEARRTSLVAGMPTLAKSIPRDWSVPDLLTSTDHPPAATMGDFADNLPGFIDHMPLWRLGELDWALRELAKAVKSASRLSDLGPGDRWLVLISPEGTPLRRLRNLDDPEDQEDNYDPAPEELKDFHL